MIHHLGPLVRRGEITISQHDRFKAWLQLFGQEAPIRIELDSEKPSGMAGYRFSFQPNATCKPKFNDLPVVPSIQFGKLVALRLENVTPPICTQNNIPFQIDAVYQCDFQLAWQTESELINISINPARLTMHCTDASLGTTENLSEASFPKSPGNSINTCIEKIDNAFGNDCSELLISAKMPTESQLEDLANLQIQTNVPHIEFKTGNKMIEFIKEISEQDKNILIRELLEPPIQTPAAEDMSNSELRDKVVEILGRLSMLGVEFKRCEHFDDKMLYAWLVNKVIPREKVHPELHQHQISRLFDTSLWCEACGIYQQI